MKAHLSTYRQSPRKVRLIADVIRGKDVLHALSILRFLNKRAAHQMKKLLESAIANAKHNAQKEAERLMVQDVTVTKGVTMKRYMPRARGRASQINKRTSHVHIALVEKK